MTTAALHDTRMTKGASTGAYPIVEINEAAMSGGKNGQPAAFYGH
jgi:hypothetical protein